MVQRALTANAKLTCLARALANDMLANRFFAMSTRRDAPGFNSEVRRYFVLSSRQKHRRGEMQAARRGRCVDKKRRLLRQYFGAL